jgi:ATP-dependent RNA helicase DDX54/DBP10
VARAGQFGTSYSIVSPDEIAYLLDLHLFLSKPLSFGSSSEGAVIGRVPQEFIENEGNSLSNLFQNKLRTELVRTK